MEGSKSFYLSDSTHNCVLQRGSVANQIILPPQSIATVTWK
jgi:hypothetical protein